MVVIAENAGIHFSMQIKHLKALDSRLRGNDRFVISGLPRNPLTHVIAGLPRNPLTHVIAGLPRNP